jgi:hypothetical protein
MKQFIDIHAVAFGSPFLTACLESPICSKKMADSMFNRLDVSLTFSLIETEFVFTTIKKLFAKEFRSQTDAKVGARDLSISNLYVCVV